MRTEQITYFRVKVSELEQEIKERYDLDIELVACEEWNNDSQHEFMNVNGEFKYPWDAEILRDVFNGNGCSTRLLLCSLVKDGHIEPGNYLVSVYW